MIALCYKCGYDWNYKGGQRGKENLSCPKCSYRLRADRTLTEDLHTRQETLHDSPLKLHETPEKIHTYIHKKKKLYSPNLLKPIEIKRPIEIIEDVEEEEFELEEIFIDGKACELHNLPATYDSFDRKWVCEKCLEFEIPNAKPHEKNLGIVTYIQKEKSIKVIPLDPLRALKSQMSYI